MKILRTASFAATITAFLAPALPAFAEELTAEQILERMKAQRTRTLGFVDQSKPAGEETEVSVAPSEPSADSSRAPSIGTASVNTLQPVPSSNGEGGTVTASGDAGVTAPGDAPVVAAAGSDSMPSVSTETSEPLKIDLTIYFDFDSAVLKAASKNQLDALCQAIQLDTGDGTYQIIGHTDAKGKASYNKRLSQARAEEVVRYMTDTCGIASNRLEARGAGEEELKLPADPGSGENRRVEVQVLS